MWLLLSLTALFAWQLYFFLHVAPLEFQILDFIRPYLSLLRYLWSLVWTLKYDIIRPHYELLNACGRPCLSLPYLWHNFTFSFMSLGLSVKIQILLDHIIAYFVSFALYIWTLKSNIIQRFYKVYNACGHTYLSLPYL